MKRPTRLLPFLVLTFLLSLPSALSLGNEAIPPDATVKLIFIHHSCGENWLSDDNGGLGLALEDNNYYVSDTNYGWGPDSIGDSTDYHNWLDWFQEAESSRYLSALYGESGQNSDYTRTMPDPGGENTVIMFKSCYPNSDLGGSPGDPPSDDDWYTVGHAKYVYNQLLGYFEGRQDKLFIAITPPPILDSSSAANSREFSRWLVEDWLDTYPHDNVAVWDMHNVLTHPDNHHRYGDGGYEYEISNGPGTLYYDSDGDEHPNKAGNQKCTTEFVPLLNFFYNLWRTSSGDPPPIVYTTGSLQVLVEDSEQTPLTEVTLSSSSQPTGQKALSGITSENGSAFFKDIKTGYYSIVAELEGYETVKTSVDVHVNETTSQTITLTVESEEDPDPRGIPGFPVLSVATGLILGYLSLKNVKKGVRGSSSVSW